MVIEQIVYPIETLGPGKRIGIWLVGCNRHCPGCSNPELWSRDGWPIIDVETAANLVSSIFSENIVDGITISGGEPMEQAAELYQLTKLLAQRTNDILLYSGYTYEEICCDPIKEAVLDNVAVLIDGRYIKEENEQLILRGSKNQHIYFKRMFPNFFREIKLFFCRFFQVWHKHLQVWHKTPQVWHKTPSSLAQLAQIIFINQIVNSICAKLKITFIWK